MDWKIYIAGVLVGLSSRAISDGKLSQAIVLLGIGAFLLIWADRAPVTNPTEDKG